MSLVWHLTPLAHEIRRGKVNFENLAIIALLILVYICSNGSMSYYDLLALQYYL